MDKNTDNQSSKLKILQINLHKSICATSTLQQYIRELDIDILLIQEPYLIDGKVKLFSLCYQIFQSGDNPKAAIVINPKKVKAMIINKYCDEYTVWCIINFNGVNHHFCSVYMPPNDSKPINEILDNITTVINILKPQYLIMGGDTNAKSILWNSKHNNRRGDQIIEFTFQNNLIILNDSKIPTYSSTNGQSHIDLTFANTTTYRKILNWKVEEIETNSDHAYITFQLAFDEVITDNTQIINQNYAFNNWVLDQSNKKYCIKKANWNLFSEKFNEKSTIITSNIDNIITKEELETITECLIKSVIQICDESIPMQKHFSKSVHWWTQEIGEKRKLVNRLRRQYQKSNTQSSRDVKRTLYYNQKIIYQNMIRESKIKSWRKFCLESDTWGLPYILINNKLKIECAIPNFIKDDQTFTATPQESIKFALDKLFPKDYITVEKPLHKQIREEIKTPISTANDLEFTQNEVSEIINNLKPKKSPGFDQINNEILKKMQEINPDLLTKLFNKCLQLGYFPKIWKISNVKNYY